MKFLKRNHLKTLQCKPKKPYPTKIKMRLSISDAYISKNFDLHTIERNVWSDVTDKIST